MAAAETRSLSMPLQDDTFSAMSFDDDSTNQQCYWNCKLVAESTYNMRQKFHKVER